MTLSEKNLRWQPPRAQLPPDKMHKMLCNLDLTWNLSSNRMESYLRAENNGRALWKWLQTSLTEDEARALETDLGVYIRAGKHVPPQIPLRRSGASKGTPLISINSVRPARRVNMRGQQSIDLVIELIQRYEEKDAETGLTNTHRGGCTLLIDMEAQLCRYAVRKRVGSAARIAAEQGFIRGGAESSSSYFTSDDAREPFAMTHRGL